MEQEAPCDRITKITEFLIRARDQLDFKIEAAHSKTKKLAVIEHCENLWGLAKKSILTAIHERDHPCSTPGEVHHIELLQLRAVTEDFRLNRCACKILPGAPCSNFANNHTTVKQKRVRKQRLTPGQVKKNKAKTTSAKEIAPNSDQSVSRSSDLGSHLDPLSPLSPPPSPKGPCGDTADSQPAVRPKQRHITTKKSKQDTSKHNSAKPPAPASAEQTALNKTILLNHETILLNDETIRLNDEAILLNDETIRLNDETIRLNDEAILLDDETIRLNDETIRLNDKAILLDDETIRLNDDTIRLNDETIRLNHETILQINEAILQSHSPTHTAYCRVCNFPESEDSNTFLTCIKCIKSERPQTDRAIYCSLACSKLDWPKHKTSHRKFPIQSFSVD